MNFFWVWSAKRLKRYTIVVLAALFTAGILYVERTQIPVFSTGEKPVAIYKVETEDKDIALTFNISWGEERAVPILDVLKENSVTDATFFLSAAWAERHPEIVERILEDGHEIGSHGFRHEHYTKWEDESIKKDILTAHEIIKKVSDTTPQYLRPPNGNFDERVLTIAEKLNYDVIHWSIDSQDWLNPGADVITENVVTSASPGDIVLFHASDSAQQTGEALPGILKKLKSDGFNFVSLSELMTGADTKTEEIR
ncbi:polysaccharide deacetylase family sporulation protein PdaB [Alteribacter natronophilus]|uniref:polysaccharide deacetylase family sporulation protein PdaB n=1 Tax=Alteribacter natronophilus TaxID=2583810 RepID=UPI00110E3855|nr:polysaccharide deacetylase family sporulation protein PdaB [Alteribacter natronophilus]TMW70076.1 polysaccharide deacetylase family sporulation protein PdaB [Alteribacter natronophilus]